MQTVIVKCKKCGSDIPETPGYITWCDKCSWNVNPYEYNGKKKALEKFYEFLGNKLSSNLFKSIANGYDIKSRITPSKAFTFLFATLIYTMSGHKFPKSAGK